MHCADLQIRQWNVRTHETLSNVLSSPGRKPIRVIIVDVVSANLESRSVWVRKKLYERKFPTAPVTDPDSEVLQSRGVEESRHD